jgi:glutamyl-tRNA reductase
VSGDRKLLLVGLSHHSAPVEIRERFAFDDGAALAALHNLVRIPGIEEGALVSTCNRVEIVACGAPGAVHASALSDFLAREQGVAADDFAGHLYAHEDRAAARHLFRVAASLDSMVVGEPQILGQLKESYQRAAQAESARAVLHRLFHKSFSAAKRVRTETGIAAKSVSVASVAVELAAQIFESFDDKNAMLIGAGKMSELTARYLRDHGIGSMIFANRTFDRAVELAREFRGTPVPFEDIPRYLKLADVVIGSTGATDFLLTPEVIQEVLPERSYRPVLLIDLAVPRNFDPRINDLQNVYLYDIDDLESVIADNKGARDREAARAETIIEQEVDSFWQWFQTLDVVPTIVELRGKAEGIRRRELDRVLASLPGLEADERAAIEAMAEAIVNKILHDPISRLRQQNGRGTDDLAVLRRLFGLEPRR